MVDLRIARHSSLPVDVVECWESGKLVGVIYPSEAGVKIISKHMSGRAESAAMPIQVEDDPAAPAVAVQLIWS